MWRSISKFVFTSRRGLHTSTILAKIKVEKTPDLILDKLNHNISSQSHVELFELTKNYSSVMNNGHVTKVYENLLEITKNSKMDLHEIKSHPEFENLCNYSIQKSRFFNMNQVFTILKVLSCLKIQSNNKLSETFFENVRNNLTTLSTQQLLFANFLLCKQESTPLIERIKCALPVVLQSSLDKNSEDLSLAEELKCLDIYLRNNMQTPMLRKIIKAIIRKADELTPHNALGILIQSGFHKFRIEELNNLQRKASEILACNIDILNKVQVFILLNCMRRSSLFLESLFESLISKALSERWDLATLSSLLNCLNRHYYSNIDILNLVQKRIIEASATIDKNPRIDVRSLIQALALSSNINPEVGNILANCENKLHTIKIENNLMYLCAVNDLAYLGSCPPSHLASIFEANFLKSFLNPEKNIPDGLSLNTLLSLHWTAKYELNSEHHLSSEQLAQTTNFLGQLLAQGSFPLSSYLASGLGGPQFFRSGVWSSEGHFIDQLVILKKDKLPLSINEDGINTSPPYNLEFNPISDLDIPSDVLKIAILVTKPRDYCSGSNSLKGRMCLKIRALEKLGYNPLVIFLPTLQTLSDEECVPYLMNKLNLLYEKLETKENANIIV